MSHTETGMHVAGAWLAIASAVLALAIIVHGPIHPDLSHQMNVIAEGSTRWAIAHWAAAAALSLFAVTGLIVLAAGSRLTEDWWTMSAWGVLPVGALWTMTTAVAEATAVADAAVAGNTAMFEAWWAFSEGKATGFALMMRIVSSSPVPLMLYATVSTGPVSDRPRRKDRSSPAPTARDSKGRHQRRLKSQGSLRQPRAAMR
jgi:hypothetical protein